MDGESRIGRFSNWSSVRDVALAGLCMGCGVCESVCPESAVKMSRNENRGIYLPVVDVQVCKECGKCLRVCPGVGVSLDELASKFLQGSTRQEMIGVSRTCYVGHASSHTIRYNSASGGLITALLVYTLDHGLIDGALVSNLSGSSPLETKPLLATDSSELMRTSGSMYCPTATCTGLREILSASGRFAFVGLPCQIHAVRKMESIDPRLREKIVLHLGLFCANNNTFLGTDYFLRRNGINPEEVRQIRYRWGGWPGGIHVTLRNGAARTIPRGSTEKRWYRRALFSSAFHYDFMIPRCLLCPDQTAELADISFGDPWLKKYMREERIGKSLVIVRNKYGEELLASAAQDEAVVLSEVALRTVKRAQNYTFKRGAGARIRIRDSLGLVVPSYGDRDLIFETKDVLLSFRYLTTSISHHRWLWPLLSCLAVVHYLLQIVVTKAKVMLASLRRDSEEGDC